MGHRYTAESLLARQVKGLDGLLGVAVRTLDERTMLARAFATHAEEHDQSAEAAGWSREADEAQQKATVLRQLLGSNSA